MKNAKFKMKNILVAFLLVLAFEVQGIKAQQNKTRDDVIEAYKEEYLGSFFNDFKWNGSKLFCNAGKLNVSYILKAEMRINYFRKLVGLNTIRLNDSMNHKAQLAALIMFSNDILSHHIDDTWKCYSKEGANGAENSNLAKLGTLEISKKGVSIISIFIEDPGAKNYPCGHRRWLLYSRANEMGYGCTGKTEAVYIGSDNFLASDKLSVPDFIAYPPKGFIPAPLVFNRWSFAIPDANVVNYSNTKVSAIDSDGNSIKLKQLRYREEYGDPTIIWEMKELFKVSNSIYKLKDAYIDKTIRVSINNVEVDGIEKNYSYEVTIINPE